MAVYMVTIKQKNGTYQVAPTGYKTRKQAQEFIDYMKNAHPTVTYHLHSVSIKG